MKRTKIDEPMSEQVQDKVKNAQVKKEKPKLDGNIEMMISTGSTLLDLAISGGRVRGGGIPAGIMVEIFGPSSTGKTVLLTEIAGNVQNQNGSVMFHDPEARLNAQFAQLFGFELNSAEYSRPNLVPEVFQAIRAWEPEDPKAINGIFADSLAALSTDMEMGSEEGDKMGGRRAKEFSQELRRTCRMLANKNYLLVCSNQIRDTMATVGPKTTSPGGKAINFYSSLRLKTDFAYQGAKMYKEKTHAGKVVKKVVGINIDVEVFKSTVWKPLGTAPVTIIFDYGIDDVRQNLQYVKKYTDSTTYVLGEDKLDKGLDKSIAIIEDEDLEDVLREEVIDLWEVIEEKFKSDRKPKKR